MVDYPHRLERKGRKGKGRGRGAEERGREEKSLTISQLYAWLVVERYWKSSTVLFDHLESVASKLQHCFSLIFCTSSFCHLFLPSVPHSSPPTPLPLLGSTRAKKFFLCLVAGPPGTRPLPQAKGADGGSESEEEEDDDEGSEDEEAKTVSMICSREDESIMPVCSYNTC